MKVTVKLAPGISPTAQPIAQPAAPENFANRESWLHKAADLLAPRFAAAGLALPPVHVSVGFGFARSGTSKRILGQAWDKSASADGKAHVFVSPIVADNVSAVATLIHELIHATLGAKEGHGPAFKRAALALGLVGPMRSTLPGDGARAAAVAIVAALGDYPHAALNVADRARAGMPKQATRLLKYWDAATGYTVRVTAKWIALYGAPICPANNQPMTQA